jgi:hypothetical protein
MSQDWFHSHRLNSILKQSVPERSAVCACFQYRRKFQLCQRAREAKVGTTAQVQVPTHETHTQSQPVCPGSHQSNYLTIRTQMQLHTNWRTGAVVGEIQVLMLNAVDMAGAHHATPLRNVQISPSFQIKGYLYSFICSDLQIHGRFFI